MHFNETCQEAKLLQPFMMTQLRLLTREQAAEYTGLSVSAFDNWVKAFRLLGPIPIKRRWDKKAIDATLGDISGITANDNEDAFDAWEKKHGTG